MVKDNFDLNALMERFLARKGREEDLEAEIERLKEKVEGYREVSEEAYSAAKTAVRGNEELTEENRVLTELIEGYKAREEKGKQQEPKKSKLKYYGKQEEFGSQFGPGGEYEKPFSLKNLIDPLGLMSTDSPRKKLKSTADDDKIYTLFVQIGSVMDFHYHPDNEIAKQSPFNDRDIQFINEDTGEKKYFSTNMSWVFEPGDDNDRRDEWYPGCTQELFNGGDYLIIANLGTHKVERKITLDRNKAIYMRFPKGIDKMEEKWFSSDSYRIERFIDHLDTPCFT
jgi:hypothetical protein